MKKIYSLAISIMLLSGCKPDKEIITGSISGFISTLDQSAVLLNDQSGVEVNLYRDTAFIDSKLTDSKGKYTFEALPYGKYHIDAEKEGYVPDWDQHVIHHIGGYSPTLANLQVYEIPTYVLSIDSISFDNKYGFFAIYVKFNGDTILQTTNYGYAVRAFFGNSTDVDKDNNVAAGKAYLTDTDYEHFPKKMRTVVRMYTWDLENDAILRTGTFYLRLYPLAMGQGYWIHEYLPEALGSPSVNTIEFNYTGLVGNR
jgi:hypothetical protein